MNRVVVIRAAAGLAAYLTDQGAGRDAAVVIGYDARHNSDVFARDTAEVMTGRGPARAGAAAAAAHAPAGVRDPRARLRGRRDGDRQPQPAPRQRLQGLPRRRQPDRAARRTPRSRPGSTPSAPLADVPRGSGGTVLGEDDRRRLPRHGGRPRRPTARATCELVYTPLHGVGGTSVVQVLETAGFERAVRRGAAGGARPGLPDRELPQPRGAGRDGPRDSRWPPERGVDLVVANDPDADRCAAAVPDAHGWRMLRGDEVGALLAHHLLTHRATPAPTPARSSPRACSASWRPPPASRSPRR